VVVITLPKGDGARGRAGLRPANPQMGLFSTPAKAAAAVTFMVGLIMIMLPSQTRNMYLPLFVTQVLGEAPGTVGPLFTINACVAVITMPYVGAAADRFGSQRIMYVGALAGAVYCILQSLATTYTQTFVIQMLVGFGIALWSTAALIYLQRLMPENAGMAGGLYVATQQFTPVISGLLLGPVAEVSGIPMAFAITGVCSLAALALLAVGHRALAV
jgi:MFS family permease